MFELEQSIAEWRRQMLAAGIKAPVPLEELENHLREEIARLERSGIRGQQAFEEAVLKIGSAQELKMEFSRASRWRGILEMELIKEKRYAKGMSAFFMVVSNLLFLTFAITVICRLGHTQVMTFPERMSAAMAVLLSYLLFSSGFLGSKFFPMIPGRRSRLAVGAAFGVLTMLGTMIFLALVNCDLGRFLMAFCWVFIVPIGAWSGLVFGLEKAAHDRKTINS